MKYYRVNEVSTITGWSESKIRRWTDLGRIPGTIRIGNNKERLFTQTSIDKIKEEKGEN